MGTLIHVCQRAVRHQYVLRQKLTARYRMDCGNSLIAHNADIMTMISGYLQLIRNCYIRTDQHNLANGPTFLRDICCIVGIIKCLSHDLCPHRMRQNMHVDFARGLLHFCECMNAMFHQHQCRLFGIVAILKIVQNIIC